jgi:hypothetical protein
VNDTSPKVAALMHALLMRRTPEERVMMGFSMFDSARKLVEAGLKASGMVEGTFEFRRSYLERMYGSELTREQIDRIAARLPAGQ